VRPLVSSVHPHVPFPRGRYGRHLSKAQVAELVVPPLDVLELVHTWLEHHGVLPSTITTKHGGSLLTLIGVPVSRANNLLSASYQLYQHIGTNETVLRTLSYGLPGVFLAHVHTVVPTTHFGFSRSQRQKPLKRPSGEAGAPEKAAAGERGTPSLSSRAQDVTPSTLRWQYETLGYVPSATLRNVLAVGGYFNQYPSPDDLSLFMNEHRTDGDSATFTVIQIEGGGYDANNPGYDANMNIQYAEAMAYPTTLVFYSIGTGSSRETWGDDGLVNWLHYVLSQTNVPQTISTSYSGPEYLYAPDYVRYACYLFAQLGLRGASVLFSSGNDGVGAGNCQFNDDSGTTYTQFLPTFPSTCTCGVFSRVIQALVQTTHHITHAFRRSLGHECRRNDGQQTGGGGGYLWWRLLGVLSAAELPGLRRTHLPSELRKPL
jgi:tripeptidyl-peptidase-1